MSKFQVTLYGCGDNDWTPRPIWPDGPPNIPPPVVVQPVIQPVIPQSDPEADIQALKNAGCSTMTALRLLAICKWDGKKALAIYKSLSELGEKEGLILQFAQEIMTE